LTRNDFSDYIVSLEFEWPIGNRKAEAQLRRARFSQAQAIAAHRDTIESVILEVQQAVRDVQTRFDEIGPNYRSASVSQEWVEATKARQERRDPPSLQVELDAYEQLAAARTNLLDVLVKYNVALSNLERRKGTLLKYHNVAISGDADEDHIGPYRPTLP
jgi:outer membrane protein TolC